MHMGRWFVVFTLLVLCIGFGTTREAAASCGPYAPAYTFNNNFSIVDATNKTTGGGNDILFTWDGTLKTSVAVSGQVSNASISSYGVGCFTGTGGTKWVAHDAAVYGPGTYTVYASCPAKSPGCTTGTNPITFTVGANEIGVHMLVDWGTVSTNKNIDVVDVWQQKAVFGPSPMWTGACGSGNASQVWDLMSKPNPATPTINGYAMVDGPFIGTRWNFNILGPPITRAVQTSNNNFTMIDGTGATFGGTNDVCFTWDGTQKTSIAVSGQVTNASLSSSCNFFGHPWAAHDVAIYGPGTYTIYDGCAAGSPGCGIGNPVTFSVNSGELGVHMLFFWGGSDDIDVVDVWQPNAVFGQSIICDGTTDGFLYGCGTNSLYTVWDHMSYDWNGDGINGAPMTDGPFRGSYANFNVMGMCAGCGVCDPLDCNDNNACTTDICEGNICIHTPISCDDNNACTFDSCDPVKGCIHTPIYCCSACESPNLCDPVRGCPLSPCMPDSYYCNDNNACTTDTCDSAVGCVHTPISCDDNNACTSDLCDPATGCKHVVIHTDDFNACTIDSCDPVTGVSHTPIICNDNNICTIDTCKPSIGCVYTFKCDDNTACTTDTCDAATGACSHTPTAVCIDTVNNNLTVLGETYFGSNDVHFTWDGTLKTSVAASGQIANATISTSCLFFGQTLSMHDVAIYGPGTYTVYSGCGAGSPGCGAYGPVTFTVGENEIGGHMLYDWNSSANFDIVNVWQPHAVFGPSEMWTEACGSNPADKVWDWMSKDVNGYGTNGVGIGEIGCSFFCPILNFNLMGTVNCDDGNSCTDDAWNSTNNPADVCVHTAISCDDGNVCTADSCDPATGCVHTPINGTSCNDGNACTTNDVCTNGTCGGTPVVCPAPAACKATGVCQPATGTCTYADLADGTSCDDGLFCNGADSCSGGTCSVHSGNLCVYPYVCVEMLRQCERTECSVDADCNDRDVCTTDTCYPTELPYVNVCGHTLNKTICPSTTGNNFTMLDPGNNQAGGTNDVVFAWDGTKRTSVAVSGQVSNALITSSCSFFGVPWSAHDVTVYGPGTYCVYTDCPAGSPGCGLGAPICFTVKTGEIGLHMLFDWNGNNNIDVVNVLKPNAVFPNLYTGPCGSNSACTVWGWSSYDPDGDGIPGFGMVDGPFQGMSANFNLNKVSVDLCCDSATRCNDNNACTVDTCNPATGACVYSPIPTDDGNACTIDSCGPTGVVHTPINCNDGNACTTDTCDPARGCVHTPVQCPPVPCSNDSCNPITGCVYDPIDCSDGNACTSDWCDPVNGCQHIPISCDDNNICTADSCSPATGCAHTPIVPASCNDNNACTIDGCANNACTHTAISADDNDICTIDSCNPATGVVHTPVIPSSCNDNNVCTIDGCTNNACTHTPINCNDNNACTSDSCDPATGCVHTPITCEGGIGWVCVPATGGCVLVCDDNNPCTIDTFDPATGCVHTPIPGCVICPVGTPTTVTIVGGGQNPNTVDKEIETTFRVLNNSGCILSSTKSSVNVTVGTTLQYDVTAGTGPQPSDCNLAGSAVLCGTNQITLLDAVTVKLILDNKANGGSDTDRITISAQ